MLWKRNVSIAAKSFAAALIRNSVLTSAEIIIITGSTVTRTILYVMFTDYSGKTDVSWPTFITMVN